MGEAKEEITDEITQARGAVDNDLSLLEARIKRRTGAPCGLSGIHGGRLR